MHIFSSLFSRAQTSSLPLNQTSHFVINADQKYFNVRQSLKNNMWSVLQVAWLTSPQKSITAELRDQENVAEVFIGIGLKQRDIVGS